MNLKKFAGYLLAVLTLCSPSTTVAEATDVEVILNDDNLSYPAETFTGSGNSIHSNGDHQYTLGGGDLTLDDGSTMTIYDVNVTNNIISGTANLLLGTGAVNGTTLGSITGTATITLQGAKNITFTQAVAAKALTMSNTATVALQNNLTLTGGAYSQSSGTVDLSAGKTISANSINTTGGTVNLGNGATLTTTGTGNIAIANTTVTNGGNTSITAGGAYSQTGNSSNVSVANLSAGGNVTLSGGQTTVANDITGGVVNITNTTSASNIGTTSKKVTSYTQGTGADVTLSGDINSTGAVQINGGDLTAANIKTGGAYSQAATTTVNANSIAAEGNVTLTGGQTTVTNDITGAVVNITNTTSAVNIGTTSKKVTSYTQDTGSNVTLSGEINSTGDVQIKAGSLGAAGIKSANGAYTQNTTTTVDISGGNLETKNGITVSNGSLKAHNLTATAGGYSQTTGGKVTATGDLDVTGNVTLAGGETAVTGNIKGGVITITNKTSADNIGLSGSAVTSYTQNTGADVTLTGDINSAGDIKLTKGKFSGKNLKSTAGKYTQETTEAVTLTGGSIDAYDDVTISAGDLSAVNITSANGKYEQTTGGTVSLTGDLTTKGNITLTSGTTSVRDILSTNSGALSVSNGLTARNIGTSGSKIASYTQNAGAVASFTGAMYSAGDVTINAGTLTAGDINAGGIYSQVAGTSVTVAPNKSISAASVNTTGGTLNLGNGSSLNSSTGAISFKDTTVKDDSNNASVSAANGYTQSGSSDIKVKNLSTTAGDVVLSGGTLQAGTVTSAGKFTQTTNNTVTVSGDLNAGDKVSLSAGQTQVTGDIKTSGAVEIANTASAKNIGAAGSKVASYTQNTGAGVNLTGDIYSGGTVAVNAGTLSAKNINADGAYTQAGGTVNIDANKGISAASVTTMGGTINLGNTSFINSTTGAISLKDTTVTDASNSSSINAANGYSQSGSSDIKIKTLSTTAGDVAISGGTLQAGSVTSAGKYTQTTNNTIAITGDLTAGDKITLTSGKTQVTGDIKTSGAVEISNETNARHIGLPASKITTYTQNTGANVNLSGDINTSGNVAINGGMLSANNVSSGGVYSQAADSTVGINANKTLSAASVNTTGGTINLGNGSSFKSTTGDMVLSGMTINGGNASITSAGAYTQSGTGTINIGSLSTTSTSTGDVAINGGTLNVGTLTSKKDLTVSGSSTSLVTSGKTTVTGTLSQSGGTITSAASDIDAGTISLTGGSLNIGSENEGAKLRSTSGDITIGNVSINADVGNKGTIESANGYVQNNSGAKVKIKKLLAKTASITGGTLNANNIGESTEALTSYEQTSGAKVTTTDLYANTVNIDGAATSLSATNVSSTTGTTIKAGTVNIGSDLSTGTLSVQGGSLDAGNVTATGNVSLTGGVTSVTHDLLSSGTVGITNAVLNAANIGSNSKRIASYSQGTGASVTLTGSLYSTGDVAVNSGSLSLGDINSSNGVYSQGAGSLVTIADGKKITAQSVNTTGGQLNLGTDSLLTSSVGAISLADTIVNGSAGTIVANGAYSQSGASSVEVSSLKTNSTTTGDITINGGSLNVGKLTSAKDLTVSGGTVTTSDVTNVTGTLSQTGGTINSASSNINAGTVNLSGGDLNIGSVNTGATIKSTGNFTVSGTATINKGGSKSGVIDAAAYTQTGADNKVYLNKLLASSGANISNGTLSVNYLGDSANKAQSYTQTGGDVTIGNLYTINDVLLSGGKLTLDTYVDVGGDFTVSGAGTQFVNNITNPDNFKVAGTFNQGEGTVVIIGNGKTMTVGSYDVGTNAALYLMQNASINTTKKFSVTGGTVSDEYGEGNGTGLVSAGEQYLQTAGTVTVNKITANTNNGQVNLQGGTLTANSVGASDAKVYKFSQTGGTSTITDVYAANTDIKNMATKVSGITNITTDNYTQQDVEVELNNLTAGNVSLSKTTRDTILTVNKTMSTTGTMTIDNSTLNIVEKLLGANSRMNVQNGGTLSLTNNAAVNLNELYVTNSTINLGSNAAVTGNDLVFTDAEIKMGDKAKLSGGINLWNTTSINQTSQNKYGIIESTGYYNQATSGKVYLDQIFATGVTVDNSELHVNDIGTTASKINSYNQKNGANVDADKIFATGNVTVTGGNLTVNAIGSSGHKVDSYDQKDDVVQVNIGSGGIYATHGVQVNAGKLVANGDINSETYVQSAEADVDLKAGKKINAKSIAIEDSSKLSLGDNSQIVSTEKVDVTGSAKITDANNSATIDITGNYTQNGLNTDVAVKDLKATGNVNVQSGKLTVSNIGLATAKVQNYLQGTVSASPVVQADYIYLSKSATVDNGSLTVNKLLQADDTVNIFGGSIDVKEKLTANNVYQEAGTLTLSDDASVTASNYMTFTKTGKVVLGNNSELVVDGGTGSITVNNGGSINKASAAKTGTIQASAVYTQADNTTSVYTNKILAPTVNVYGGSLNANSIGSSDNYATAYNQSITDTGVTDVNVENIYALTSTITGGNFTLGQNSPSSVFSSTHYLLNGGTINLYNTTFKAPSSADETTTKVDINGAVLNVYGDNTIGLYDTSKNIYSATIGTGKDTEINIGNGDASTDVLNLDAGAGNFIIGQYAKTTVDTDGILNLTSAKGNITFEDNSTITNRGQINIYGGFDDKKVELANINTDISSQGAISNFGGNAVVKKNIYTQTYEQTAGSTTVASNAQLTSSSTGDGVTISGGSLVLNGAGAKVSVENGTFKTQNEGTSINITNGGTETAITAKTISIDKTGITADKGSDFVLSTGGVEGGSIAVSNSTIDAKEGSAITIETENATATISNSTLTSDGDKSNLAIQGGTTITNTQLETKNNGGISLDTTNGNITLNADTAIKNAGQIIITGDSNIATINSVINSDGSKVGLIEKTEGNKLIFGTTVNAGAINLTAGTTEANGNINLSGNFVVEGNTQDEKMATFELTSGNTLQSDESVILGSLTNYAYTDVILDNGSKIIAKNVSVNSGLDMTKATIQANENVTIGQKADITVKHYAGDGDNVTKSTIQGTNIYLSGGANITVKEKARLEYIGNIISDDTHYTIEKGATWDINSGTYTNSYYEELPGGGMLTNAGDVFLSNNVNFQNSKAKYNGGAVYNTGNLRAKYNAEVGLWADNTSFVGNKAGYSDTGIGDAANGGALYNGIAGDETNGAVLLGDTTTFAGNVASGSGGGLYNVSGDGTNANAVKIGKNSVFDQNVSKSNGGAIFAGGTGTVEVGESTTFSRNLAGFANPSEFSNATFAQPSYLAALSDGGAIAVESNAKIFLGHRASFTSNASSKNGGAIANAGTIYFNRYTDNDGNIKYNSSTEDKAYFAGNGIYSSSGNIVRTAKGGAIYNTGNFVTVKEDGSEYNGLYKIYFGGDDKNKDGNTAVKGGAIYNKLADDATLAITKSTFKNNYAEEENGGDGGAIYNESGIVQIQQDTQFLLNTANQDGGAIYNAGTLVMDEGTAIGDYENGNIAKRGGGVYNTSTLTINATKDNKVQFIANAARQAGGALYNDSPNVSNLQYVDFISNNAGDDKSLLEGKGGAIYNAQGTINISNSNIRDNFVSYNESQGGGIYNANGATINLGEKSVVFNNDANGTDINKKIYAKGGGIYNAGTLNVTDAGVAIQKNKTDGFGGGIYNSGTVNLANGAVIGGTKDEYNQEGNATAGNIALRGGGIYNDNGTLTFGDSTYFIGNESNLSGGGLHYKGADLATDGTVFYQNKAIGLDEEKGYGGGLYNDAASTGVVTVKNSTFIGNGADVGAAIYNAGQMYIDKEDNDSTMSFSGGTNYFKGNVVGSAIGNEGTLELAPTFEFGHKPNSITPNAGAIANIGAGVVNAHATNDDETKMLYPSLYIHNVGNVEGNGYGVVNGAALYLGYKNDGETANDGTATINTTDFVNDVETLYEDTISSAYFEENTGVKGGAIYKDTKTDLVIQQPNKYFVNNGVQTKAMFDSNIAATTEKDAQNNNLAAGGAIYNAGKDADNLSRILIKDSADFWKNGTTGKGGAIYNGANGLVEFAGGYHFGKDTSGYSNTAEEGGGAIANEGYLNFRIDPATNRSVYFTYQGGDSNVKRVNDTNKYYSDKGGALYISGKGTVATFEGNTGHTGLLNAVFTHNEAKNGGALYVDRQSEYVLTVTNTSFSGNRGYLNGGAIYNDGEIHLNVSEFDDNVFTGNQAGNEFSSLDNNGKGGAIYNSNVMKIKRDNDPDDSKNKIFVSNRAIGPNGSGGAIYNTSEMEIDGDIAFVNNEATAQGGAITNAGSLTLHLSRIVNYLTGPKEESADIIFSQNTAQTGSAIYMAGGDLTIDRGGMIGTNSGGTLTFADADPEEGTIAQTIAGQGKIIIKGGHVNFFSDASGFKGAYQQRDGIVTVKNKFLNIEDSSLRAVTGGTIILDQGAQLSSDQLLVSNIEEESNNSAKIIFNANDKAKLTDLTALYDNSTTFNTFTYTNTDDMTEHKIALRAADVEINDTALIDKNATIGNAKNKYMVRNLTLSNGAKLDAGITVYGGETIADVGASLIMNEGAESTENASVTLKGFKSDFIIDNDNTDLTLSDIKNDGSGYGNNFRKTGDGDVTIVGDASGFSGDYNQDGGLVEFTNGSKFFSKYATTQVQSGELRIAKDVEFEPGSVINFTGADGTFSTEKTSNVDLTGATAVIQLPDDDVTVNMAKGTSLDVSGNSTVTATMDEVIIGNANQKVNSLTLGDSEVTVNPTTKFILQNDEGTPGKGGVLGFGDNVTFKDTDGNIVVPTVQLKDNTQLKLTNKNDSEFGATIQNVDNAGTPVTTWAETNGDIVKENPGKVTLSGDISDFHGTLVVKNGEIATKDSKFANDIKYDLSQLEPNAKATVSNVSQNDDMVLLGGIKPEDASSPVEVNVYNTRGSISVRNSADTADGDVVLPVASKGVITTAGNFTANNVDVLAASEFSLAAQGNAVVPGTINVKNVNVDTSKLTMTAKSDINAANINVDKTSTASVTSGGKLVFNDLVVDNASEATLTSVSANAQNVFVRENSVLNLNHEQEMNVAKDLILKNSTINLGSGNLTIGGNFTMGSTVNMMNGAFNQQYVGGNMTLTGNSDYKVDIDPMFGLSDRVVVVGNLASDTPGTTRTLNISEYNLITEPQAEISAYKIFDVQGTISDVEFTTSNNMVTTPVANYIFSPAGNTGTYSLIRTGYTPTAMASSAAVQIGGFLTQVQTYDEALASVDSVMVLPTAYGYYGNKYASSAQDEAFVYSPYYIPELDKGMWFRPYGNFEKVDLQDGPRVSNQTYGALIGADTALTELGKDFKGTLGGYIGYTGSHQSFDGVSGCQNGGVVGLTGALYKGGFFTGLTINADPSFSNMSTPNGKNDFFMLSAGVASKTGYNWELGRGRFIIQPSWLMSYTFVNAFNPPDIAGRPVDSQALHAVQLVPGLKLMANLPYGWQPYLLVDFRLNLGDKTHFKISNSSIPDTYVKSYIEYGLGMQKRWGDKFTGFGQFLARNGGRNGVGVNLGLRWAVGQGR
ncbi:MAG: hypothetical protein K6C94_03005 [Candidatus Gastranaerophilales bacterium]|nr:hypothetical protein [Candidatus Gastranaerophilales bacterium]